MVKVSVEVLPSELVAVISIAVGGGALIVEGVGDGDFTGVGIDGEEAARVGGQ